MKAQYQVVAVYPSGRRFDVRKPHDSFDGAVWHRDVAIRGLEADDTYTYEVDVRYMGADGQVHWRGNIDGPCSSVRFGAAS